MIVDFKCTETGQLFHNGKTRRFSAIKSVAERKLAMLHAATCLEDLRVPPANHLEKLIGDREGQYSIRINVQYRICFVWTQRGAEQVEIVDYHR